MSHEHKDTPESFWERMRRIHGDDVGPQTFKHTEPVTKAEIFCSNACEEAGECVFDDCPFEKLD